MAAIEITTKIGCKNACIYCPQDTFIKSYTKRSKIFQMSFNVFKKCIDKIPSSVDVWFSGMCEPCLNPKYKKMLLYAHKKGHKIELYTTLVGMNLSDVDFLESLNNLIMIIHLPFYGYLTSDKYYEKININENYLKLLNRMCKSSIIVKYVYHGEYLHPKIISLIKKNHLKHLRINIRSRNVKIKSFLKRKRGWISCKRNLNCNILLPNGDVILCCMDWGMKHILGNLLSSNYKSLFQSKEFLKIRKGLKDEKINILCRYCDIFAYDVDLFARIYNSFFYLYYYIQNIRSLKDFYHAVQKLFQKLKC